MIGIRFIDISVILCTIRVHWVVIQGSSQVGLIVKGRLVMI